MPRQKHTFFFKQFAVRHDRCTMKVGTDGVLLGAWADARDARKILDIGAGSGVIALMLAQRTSADVTIEGVEVSLPDCEQASANLAASPWSEKMELFNTPVQEFMPVYKYDLIVSNPPYFMNSFAPPSASRYRARHTVSLSYDELLFAVNRLLSPNGKFCVVLPTTEGNQFKSLAANAGLYVSRQLAFYSRKEKKQERWLLEFTRQDQTAKEETLLLYEDGENWSKEYADLMRAYYLAI